MTYAMPTNITDTVSIFSYLNNTVSNFFFPGILIAVYIIILVKMMFNQSNTASKSFAAASFMVMIISVFARIMEFVSTGFMSIFIILTAVGAIWMHIENT